jgi:tetratricopeptide (TPR) repeat protein
VSTLIALLMAMMSGSGLAALTDAQAQAIVNWVGAVQSHRPGQRDAATGRIATLTFGQRAELHEAMAIFLASVQGKKFTARNNAETQVFELALRMRVNPGTDVFLKRAAVLHSDVAILNRMNGAQAADDAVGVPLRDAAPPLLSRQRQILDKDGEIIGERISDWNWPFARSLLDLLVSKPADDPFVRTWYHATTAFMLKRGLYAEAGPHLARADAVLPDDPLVLFDRASYAEIQGLPVLQVLLSDDDVFALRARGQGRTPPRTVAQGANMLGIPLADVTNAEAERLYRRALRADGAFVEARVRLGRLLYERKRYDEAAAELAIALAAQSDPRVAFYARLFAGRTAQALGKIEDAVAHYKEAGALFPGAQSALLAQSQLALLGADMTGAAEPIHRLEQLAVAPAKREDPWWQYHFAAGRDDDTLLRAMWTSLSRTRGSGL